MTASFGKSRRSNFETLGEIGDSENLETHNFGTLNFEILGNEPVPAFSIYSRREDSVGKYPLHPSNNCNLSGFGITLEYFDDPDLFLFFI